MGGRKTGSFGLPFVAILGCALMAMLVAIEGPKEALSTCGCFGVFIAPAVAIAAITTHFGADGRTRRRGKLIRKRLCLKCGYDLRASDEICPECGRPVPAPKSAIEVLERMTAGPVDATAPPEVEPDDSAGTSPVTETTLSTGTPPPPG